jgi:hypothetical protein
MRGTPKKYERADSTLALKNGSRQIRPGEKDLCIRNTDGLRGLAYARCYAATNCGRASLFYAARGLYSNHKHNIKETSAMSNLIMNNLVFFIPMALVGFVMCGEVPVASRFVRTTLRTFGAVVGALMALLVLEALPALI